MESTQASVDVDRPIRDLFAQVTNGLEVGARWAVGVDLTEYRGVTLRQEGPRGPGQDIPDVYEVTVVEPDRRFAYEGLSGPLHPRVEYRFEASPAGTIVTLALQAEPRGLAGLAFRGRIRESMANEMKALDALKASLETPG